MVDVVKLGDIANFEYGFTDIAKDTGDCRFIRITDITDFGSIKAQNAKYIDLTEESEKFTLNYGDILVARTGATYGKTAIFKYDNKAIFASYLIRITFKSNNILPEYYQCFTQTENYWSQARDLVGGTGQPQFNANVIKEIKIPIPPLDVQQQIVNELNAKHEYIKLTEQVIEKQQTEMDKLISYIWR